MQLDTELLNSDCGLDLKVQSIHKSITEYTTDNPTITIRSTMIMRITTIGVEISKLTIDHNGLPIYKVEIMVGGFKSTRNYETYKIIRDLLSTINLGCKCTVSYW